MRAGDATSSGLHVVIHPLIPSHIVLKVLKRFDDSNRAISEDSDSFSMTVTLLSKPDFR